MKKPEVRHESLLKALEAAIEMYQNCTWDLDGDDIDVDCYISFNGIQYLWDDTKKEFFMPRDKHSTEFKIAQDRLRDLVKETPGFKGVGSSMRPKVATDYKQGMVESFTVYCETEPDPKITEFEGYEVRWRKRFPIFT